MVCTRLAILLTAFVVAVTSVDARNSHRHGAHRTKRGVFAVDVPDNLASCDTTVLSWNGTKAPYSVGLLVGDADDAPLYHLGNSSKTQYTWEVDLAPDTVVTIAVKSATGLVAYSKKLTIESGATWCLHNSTWEPARNWTSSDNSTSANSTKTSGSLPTHSVASPPNATSITSGIAAAGASATSTTTSSASHLTAGLGLLLAAALLTLVA